MCGLVCANDSIPLMTPEEITCLVFPTTLYDAQELMLAIAYLHNKDKSVYPPEAAAQVRPRNAGLFSWLPNPSHVAAMQAQAAAAAAQAAQAAQAQAEPNSPIPTSPTASASAAASTSASATAASTALSAVPPPALTIADSGKTVICRSENWETIVGDVTLTKGVHTWEVVLAAYDSSKLNTYNVVVGVLPAHYPPTSVDFIGYGGKPGIAFITGTGKLAVDGETRRYGSNAPCRQGDRVGVRVDCDKNTIEFFKNGKSMGVGQYCRRHHPPSYLSLLVSFSCIVPSAFCSVFHMASCCCDLQPPLMCSRRWYPLCR
jgi:hypothetical protein